MHYGVSIVGAKLFLQRGVVETSITPAGQERLMLAGGYEITADVVLATSHPNLLHWRCDARSKPRPA